MALSTALGTVVSVSHSVSPGAALLAGAAAALVLRRLTGASRFAVTTGVLLFAGTGLATLASGIPPSYDPGVGVAILAALVAGIAGLEVVVRIEDDPEAHRGERGILNLHADLQVNGWVRFLAWWAAALIVVVHGLVIFVGASDLLVALTLFPVATVLFAAFPATSPVHYFHAPREEAPSAIVADCLAAIPAALASLRDDLWPGSGDRIGGVVRRVSTAAAGISRSGSADGAPGRKGHGRARSGAEDQRRDEATGGTDDESAGASADSEADAGDATATDADPGSQPCQNCGSEGEDRERRPITDEYRVVLCRDCRGARVARRQTVAECRGSVYPVERGTVLGSHGGTCVGCGAGDADLELHAIVPIDGGGHPHPHNVVPLCPACHEAAH